MADCSGKQQLEAVYQPRKGRDVVLPVLHNNDCCLSGSSSKGWIEILSFRHPVCQSQTPLSRGEI